MSAKRALHPICSLLSLLLVCVLLAQTLGLMHRVAHAKQSAGLHTHTQAQGAHGVNTLWADHSSASECRLFDQNAPDLLTLSQAPVVQDHSLPLWRTLVLLARSVQFERFYAAQAPPVALI